MLAGRRALGALSSAARHGNAATRQLGHLHHRVLSTDANGPKTTHFGYTTVPEDDKEKLVGNVFDNVASKYDLMNDVMSAGVHRIWKDTFVGMIGAHAAGPGHNLQVLDVAGGTGDIAFRIANDMARSPAAAAAAADAVDGEAARIVVSDINPNMLAEGQRRAKQLPHDPLRPRMEWLTADARKLPFDDNSFDLYTIAFGIRNVTRIDEALAEAHRVLRPGGRFLCLEFSHVTNPLLAMAYERYSFDVIPKMGEMVAGDRASYQYLVESIRKFPRQQEFANMLQAAGLRTVNYTNLSFGAVAIHSGFKLPEPKPPKQAEAAKPSWSIFPKRAEPGDDSKPTEW